MRVLSEAMCGRRTLTGIKMAAAGKAGILATVLLLKFLVAAFAAE